MAQVERLHRADRARGEFGEVFAPGLRQDDNEFLATQPYHQVARPLERARHRLCARGASAHVTA